MTRYSPGTPILGAGAPLTKADTLNAILDSSEGYARTRLADQSGRRNIALPPDLVKVRNATGTELRFGEIVEISTSALTPLVFGYPWFVAAVPNETRAFAVMLEPVPNDSTAYGLAQISGCCPALVNISSAANRWAHVKSGLDVLQGDDFWGDVKIVYHPGATGEQQCWVNFEKSPSEWLCKIATSPHNKGSLGTVKVFEGTPGSETDTTRTISDCYNRTANITDTNKFCTAFRLHRKKYVAPLEC